MAAIVNVQKRTTNLGQLGKPNNNLTDLFL